MVQVVDLCEVKIDSAILKAAERAQYDSDFAAASSLADNLYRSENSAGMG